MRLSNLGVMANEALKYFMGDVYAADIGFGFLVTDRRDDDAEPTINETTARTIVAAADGDPNAKLSPVSLFEISRDEFELYKDTEVEVPDLPKGITVWQVKR